MLNLLKLVEGSANHSDMHTIEATVASGLEEVPAQEFKNNLGSEQDRSRGRVYANIWKNQIPAVLHMRSIDNVWVVADGVMEICFSEYYKEHDIDKLKKLAYSLFWDKALRLWKKVTGFQGILYPTKEEYVASLEDEIALKAKVKAQQEKDNSEKENFLKVESESVPCEDKFPSNSHSKNKKVADISLYNELDTRDPCKKVLKFRVTCYHTGTHTFTSQEAATAFGGALQDIFHWVVDLTYYDLEIVLHIKNNSLYAAMPLTKQSLHRRSITHFGPTTLRATICYCLLKLAAPVAGNVIIDPMCGGGSIPIEGALAFPDCFFLCGDVHPKATERTNLNINHLMGTPQSNISVFDWDAQMLPLKTSSVDICVTDLPFGKRMGSKQTNWQLYLNVLLELSRVIVTGGRAVILTQDKKNFIKAFLSTYGLWKQKRILTVNIGGLTANVFVLLRTSKAFEDPILPEPCKKTIEKDV